MAYTPETNFMIGLLGSGSGGMSPLEPIDGSGNYAAPKSTFKPYSKPVILGDGTVRGTGWATAEWTWDVMTRTQRDWLRGYISGMSAEVWIKTRTNDSADTFGVYKAVAIWPVESEETDATRRTKFTIKFQRLTTS